MKRAVLALLIVLSVPAVALSAPSAKKPDDKKAEEKKAEFDPENVTAISQYMDLVVKGSEKYKKADYTGAIDLFKKAIGLSPKNALGHLLLGETYLAANNMPEAEAAFLAAQEASSTPDPKTRILRSHVLFAVADCYEREKKWNEAKAAWQAYTEHAEKLGGADAGVHPASGTARKDVIEKLLAREKAYVAVRERIAADKSDGGVKPDAGPPNK
jgi:tetratricopeptide (TPR) repeat protein